MSVTLAGDYWWPRFSPDGRWLICGNERGTLIEWGTWQHTDLGPGRSFRWLTDDAIVWLDAVDERRLWRYQLSDGVRTVIASDMAGNWLEAHAGHVVSVRASDRRLAIDGAIITDAMAYGLALRWPWIVTAESDEMLVTYYEHRPSFRLRDLPERNGWSIVDRTIAYGSGWGRVYAVSLDGTARSELTVTPWQRESLPPTTATDWVWTATELADGTPALLGRRLGERNPIVVRGIAAKTFDVAVVDSEIRIAAYSDHEGQGRPGLHLMAASSDSPRETLIMPPAPPPSPEIWAPTTETVDLWALFVGASGSQYPRRNPNDPGIYWDCQVAKLGAHVEHAWFVKHPSGRVYEWRATWMDSTGVEWIGLLEDHDDQGRTYRFEDPRLMRRYAQVGDMWTWRTRISEWDRAAQTWGPWQGPGSDGTFAFRVVVRSVERSSYGRVRAILDVDTYQDLEVFELMSNKGWTAWEEWTRSAYPGPQPMPPGVEARGLRVGLRKRVEWPERWDGPRPWPSPPCGAWPLEKSSTRISIVSPLEWPQRTVRAAPNDEASLRCVYAVTAGEDPAFIEWSKDNGESWVRNPGWDLDHTFRTKMAGVYRIKARALNSQQEILDETGARREWIVE